jgi:hypothetical protein
MNGSIPYPLTAAVPFRLTDGWMCRRKVRYATAGTARTARKRIQLAHRRKKKPITLRAYACPVCDGWHLTSKPEA